jgi:hypothetical protein
MAPPRVVVRVQQQQQQQHRDGVTSTSTRSSSHSISNSRSVLSSRFVQSQSNILRYRYRYYHCVIGAVLLMMILFIGTSIVSVIKVMLVGDDPTTTTTLTHHPNKLQLKHATHNNSTVEPHTHTTNHKHNVAGIMLFVHVPKTGGTSLAVHLRQTLERNNHLYNPNAVNVNVKYLFAQNRGSYTRHIRDRINRLIHPPHSNSNTLFQSRVSGGDNNHNNPNPNQKIVYIMEFHVNDAPSLASLNSTLATWRQELTLLEIPIPFFAFTMLRDPVEWTISAFNYYCVVRQKCPNVNDDVVLVKKIIDGNGNNNTSTTNTSSMTSDSDISDRLEEHLLKMVTASQPHPQPQHHQEEREGEEESSHQHYHWLSNQQCLYLSRGWKRDTPPTTTTHTPTHTSSASRIHNPRRDSSIYNDGTGSKHPLGRSDHNTKRASVFNNKKNAADSELALQAVRVNVVTSEECQILQQIMEHQLDWVGTTDRFNNTVGHIAQTLQTWLVIPDVDLLADPSSAADDATNTNPPHHPKEYDYDYDDEQMQMQKNQQQAIANFTSRATTVRHNQAGNAGQHDNDSIQNNNNTNTIPLSLLLSLDQLSDWTKSQIRKHNSLDDALYRHFSPSRST